jgi:type II restriction enzyme
MNYKNFILKNNIRLENSFEYLYKNFIPTIAKHNYLVDWNKVNENRKEYELLLNNLNFLLNKKDSFKEDFEYLLRSNPKVVEALPILLASREKQIEFIEDDVSLETKRYVFKKPNLVNTDIINHYYSFVEKTGLKELFCDYDIKNLVDYVFGVEVGLNSNARKNRTGVTMENIVLGFLNKFCEQNNDFQFIEQATQKNIKEHFNFDIEIDKNNRRFDFALYDKSKNKLYLIEVNFYSSGGSKLKATAGEYKELNDYIMKQDITFIWITDGKGWLTALNPLEETFNHNDYVINLNMVKKGILEEICLK